MHYSQKWVYKCFNSTKEKDDICVACRKSSFLSHERQRHPNNLQKQSNVKYRSRAYHILRKPSSPKIRYFFYLVITYKNFHLTFQEARITHLSLLDYELKTILAPSIRIIFATDQATLLRLANSNHQKSFIHTSRKAH